MRPDELGCLGELRAELVVVALAAVEHRRGRLAGAAELLQGQIGMPQTIERVQIVDVALIGGAKHAGDRVGLDPQADRVAECKVVRSGRRGFGKSGSPDKQHRGRDNQAATHTNLPLASAGEYTPELLRPGIIPASRMPVACSPRSRARGRHVPHHPPAIWKDDRRRVALNGRRRATRARRQRPRARLGFIGLGNRGDQVLDAFLAHKDAEVVAAVRHPRALRGLCRAEGRRPAGAAPRLPPAARHEGRRRGRHQHARPLACAADDPGLRGGQGRLRRKAAVAGCERGTRDGRAPPGGTTGSCRSGFTAARRRL